MITRIKINGFKSLLHTELYLGAFTCIAGANAGGKSNFFDALLFLSKLADNTIIEAAKSIRSENQKHSDIKDIFYKSGNQYQKQIYFEIDMLVGTNAPDDLGQPAKTTITSLRYILELQLNDDSGEQEVIEIKKEELIPLTLTYTKQNLFFDTTPEWRNSVLQGRRSTKAPFISTEKGKIKLHQDGNKGRTTEFTAHKMPRTLLSTVTSESPTAFMARHEMRNWMMLQLEPSALRQPNRIYEVKNAEMTAYGSNLPATLYRLHLQKKDEADVYQKLTNQLKGLVSAVDEIWIDNDEKRDLLTLQIRFKGGLALPAQSLSDGTLRFLGLAILKEDSNSSLICLEEPENGIHPKKIPEIIALLKEMATDTAFSVAEDNPLRQVIINTHSPLVVGAVDDESLYLATIAELYSPQFGKKIKYTSFLALPNTWKTNNNLCASTTLGAIADYLGYASEMPDKPANEVKSQTKRTVRENYNQQLEIVFP